MQRGPLRHIIIKMPKFKDKERLLKAAKEKQKFACIGIPMRLTVYFSKETLQAGRNWQAAFKVMKKQETTAKIALSSKAII